MWKETWFAYSCKYGLLDLLKHPSEQSFLQKKWSTYLWQAITMRKLQTYLDLKNVSTHSNLNCSHFSRNVVITSLESMYNYSNVTSISMNLSKSFLCPCTWSGSNKTIAKIIPKARRNAWHTRAGQADCCDVGTFFDTRWTALLSRRPWYNLKQVLWTEGLQKVMRWFLDADDNPGTSQNLVITFWLIYNIPWNVHAILFCDICIKSTN